MKKRIILLGLALGLLGGTPLLAQGNWELQKNEDGIEVYTRQVPDNNFKEIRVVCEVPGTAAQLVSLLKDVEHHSDWVYLNRKTALLKRKSENRLVYYTEADMPWPLTDRDMVVEAAFSPVRNNQALVEVKSVNDFLPKKKEFIRIPSSLAVWEITPGSNGHIKVEYTFKVNPGGSVPAWLVNTTVAIGPLKTFQRLRKTLAQRALAQKN
ncbi:START domain-containing protein [Rufibacter roseolus]|uniref:START domain-containing protein n=1 Tax=Rufibacter roseolus TaxID=2817375 RepID=UPI001B308F6C|nr:START domain-containing protein [Rufibacter roseolus]